MKTGRCPRCRASYRYDRIDDVPGFPFCSTRCQDIDLGRWVEGGYVIPAKEGDDPTGGSQILDEDPDE